MSDLHDAVQAEIAAHQPDRTPPFELLEQRKSAQDRRHRAVAAALAGAAVTAVALAPSYVFDRGRDAPTSAAPVSRTSPPTTSSCAGDVTVTKQTGVPLTLVVPYRQEVDLALQVGDSLRVSGSGPCGSSIRPVLQGTGPLVQGSSQRFVVASSPGAASLQLTQPMCGLPRTHGAQAASSCWEPSTSPSGRQLRAHPVVTEEKPRTPSNPPPSGCPRQKRERATRSVSSAATEPARSPSRPTCIPTASTSPSTREPSSGQAGSDTGRRPRRRDGGTTDRRALFVPAAGAVAGRLLSRCRTPSPQPRARSARPPRGPGCRR